MKMGELHEVWNRFLTPQNSKPNLGCFIKYSSRLSPYFLLTPESKTNWKSLSAFRICLQFYMDTQLAVILYDWLFEQNNEQLG
jgi:hypothetical protein